MLARQAVYQLSYPSAVSKSPRAGSLKYITFGLSQLRGADFSVHDHDTHHRCALMQSCVVAEGQSLGHLPDPQPAF